MPADRLHHDLNAQHHEPCLQQALPPAVFEHLEQGRSNNQPYRYTARDVRAILNFVNEAPRTDGYTVTHTPAAAAQYQQQTRDLITAARAEKARSLAERIECPRLQDQISATPGPSSIGAPKPVLIDFTKTNVRNQIGIFTPKLTATLHRLKAIPKVEHYSHATYDQVCTFECLCDSLQALLDNIVERAPTIIPDQWQSLNYGLKELGGVSFKGLRRNFYMVLADLVRIAQGGYFKLVY